jgi:hypothetical protein
MNNDGGLSTTAAIAIIGVAAMIAIAIIPWKTKEQKKD